jgi:hypothetical protein
MPSISKGPNGRRGIQFVVSDGKRRTIRLGKVSQRLAEKVKVKVEALQAATTAGLPIESETAVWLRKIGDDLHAKLTAVGLVPARPSPGLLGEFLDRYKADRSDVKNGTRTN